MSSNLIFHSVSKRKWKQSNKGGFYIPEGNRNGDGIICVGANHLQKYINKNFQGRRQVLVLVIDKSRLLGKCTLFDQEKEIYMVEEKINIDAILDKITLEPNKEGLFDIQVSEDY